MIRVVSGYRMGFRWGVPHSSIERFLDEDSTRKAIEKQSEIDDIPVDKYVPLTCHFLEVQNERGEPTYFDLGSPVEIAR